MKKLITIFSTLVLFSAVIPSGGCSKPHKPLHMERIALTVRFFESIAARNSAAAARQGKKLYAINPSQEYILRLVSIQESNDAVGNAQNLIRQGRINEALPVVALAAKQYPDNRTLVTAYPKLIQLRNAEKLLKAMDRAKNASAMRGARIAAKAGLSRNITPAFQQYLDAYEKRESDLAKKEKDNLIASGKAVDKATIQAKKDDVDREKTNREFAEKTELLTKKGEQIRKEAGAVPFASEKKDNH